MAAALHESATITGNFVSVDLLSPLLIDVFGHIHCSDVLNPRLLSFLLIGGLVASGAWEVDVYWLLVGVITPKELLQAFVCEIQCWQ